MAKGYHPIRRRSSDPIPESHFSNTNSSSTVPSSTTRISMESLRNRLTLPLNANMAIPIYSAPPSREDVEVEGRVLFHHFIQEELIHQGIPDEILEVENPPPDVFEDIGPEMMHGDGNLAARAASPAFVGTPDGYKIAKFINIGANIRSIADKFAESREREEIRQQADEVDLGDISYSYFFNLMRELFRNGINQYRIVSLFFFISDVLIRCIRNELHRLGSKLFFWALEFLFQNVCNWVRDNGGWERVFYNIYKVLYRGLMIAALGVAFGCGVVYIRKNL